jgi:hypothetical protein
MGKFTNIEVADQGINRTLLIKQWRKVYGCPPPKYLPLRLIQSALSWEEQARVMGGVPVKTLRVSGSDKFINPTKAHKCGYVN